MIYYFTFNDQPSGIYESQVLDTLEFLRKSTSVEIRLIAFIPKANFERNKAKILQKEPEAIVLKMIFGISRWKWHLPMLKWQLRNNVEKIICRGPLATVLAMDAGIEKVIYDGRAAVKAEVEEYDVTMGNIKLGQDFIRSEKRAVLESTYRLAVSQKLVDYWKNEFAFKNDSYVIIPCTLNNSWFEQSFEEIRKNHGNVKLVYSGGTGPWQSFELVVKMLRKWLKDHENGEVLFMTRENVLIDELISEFPERVERKFVGHEEVKKELSSCDYGILIREDRVTNQVASPVKFAEYLSAGLKILISEGIGDYSELTHQLNCGQIIFNEIPRLTSVDQAENIRMKSLCSEYFRKEKYKEEYNRLIRI
ncbi:MAG: hypothetical protein H6599_02685 [Flavobacteriales bacterium]|nr:hypothetical protein [Flavobacteriales bacterium]